MYAAWGICLCLFICIWHCFVCLTILRSNLSKVTSLWGSLPSRSLGSGSSSYKISLCLDFFTVFSSTLFSICFHLDGSAAILSSLNHLSYSFPFIVHTPVLPPPPAVIILKMECSPQNMAFFFPFKNVDVASRVGDGADKRSIWRIIKKFEKWKSHRDSCSNYTSFGETLPILDNSLSLQIGFSKFGKVWIDGQFWEIIFLLKFGLLLHFTVVVFLQQKNSKFLWEKKHIGTCFLHCNQSFLLPPSNSYLKCRFLNLGFTFGKIKGLLDFQKKSPLNP